VTKRRWALVLVLVVSSSLSACGEAEDVAVDRVAPQTDLQRPVPRIGRGKGYRIPSADRHTSAGRPVGRFRCTRAPTARYGTHLEVFANRLDVVVPAGIGIAAPRKRDGAYVTRGRCEYPVRTREPTGLIEVDRGAEPTLGEFFDVWGQPLDRRRVLGFRASRGEAVSAFVNGVRWRGDPRSIPLTRHAAIVVEVGGWFPPTPRYLFPPGL
jgi:hypothetical protein